LKFDYLELANSATLRKFTIDSTFVQLYETLDQQTLTTLHLDFSPFTSYSHLCGYETSTIHMFTTDEVHDRWRLVEVDADLTAMERHRSHLLSLICPSSTYMDLNIGTALWLAAKGEGWAQETPEGPNLEHKKVAFKSSARVLLVGAGADEQCGGYSRHRTKFRLGGYGMLFQPH
jgi:hypothetical protein